MQALSASTTIADPYRAALSLGSRLSVISPEIVLMFGSPNAGQWDEFVQGLFDGLGSQDVALMGASGDGFYESAGIGEAGYAALGLNSGASVNWHIAVAGNVAADPAGAVRHVLATLRRKLAGQAPAFYILACDPAADASSLEDILRDEVEQPVVGGLASHDGTSAGRSFVIAGKKLLSDSLVMLAVAGPVSFCIHVGNSISTVGRSGRVGKTRGKQLLEIDGVSAADFVQRELGKPIVRSDQGIALTVLSGHRHNERRLRAVSQEDQAGDGSLTLFGGVSEGDMVRVSLARPRDLEAEVRSVAAHAAGAVLTPAAALIVSCAGRKWMLGGRIGHEVSAIADAFGKQLPVIGFPAFGEIAPVACATGYSRNLFHNMTYVLLLIGTEPCSA